MAVEEFERLNHPKVQAAAHVARNLLHHVLLIF
jgi:hypothetical protein